MRPDKSQLLEITPIFKTKWSVRTEGKKSRRLGFEIGQSNLEWFKLLASLIMKPILRRLEFSFRTCSLSFENGCNFSGIFKTGVRDTMLLNSPLSIFLNSIKLENLWTLESWISYKKKGTYQKKCFRPYVTSLPYVERW